MTSLTALITEQKWADEIDFVENGHIKLFANGSGEDEDARRDCEAAEKAGVDVSKVKWIGTDEMRTTYGAKDATGAWIPAANVWPIKLVTRMFLLGQDLAAASVSNSSPISIQLFTHTLVTSITHYTATSAGVTASNLSTPSSTPNLVQHPRARWTLHTSRGQIRARYIVHATNAYASYLLPQLASPPPTTESPPVPLHKPHQLERQQNASSTTSSPSSALPSMSSAQTAASLHSDPMLEAKKPRALWIVPTRGQVIATRAAELTPSELWKSSWLANRGWEYWFPRYWPSSKLALMNGERNMGKVEEKALVILGGAREHAGGTREMGVTDDSTLNPHVSSALLAFLPQTFPGMFKEKNEPLYEWVSSTLCLRDSCCMI